MIPFLSGIRHAIYNLNKRIDLLQDQIKDMLGLDSSSIQSLITILTDKDASTGILNALLQKADKTEIPTNTSDLTNDSGYITVDDSGHLQINEQNVTIISNQPFPSTWPTTNQYTLQNLVDAIDADPDAVKGKTYMSTVHYSDLNSAVGLYDGELKVEIMESSGSHKIARFTISSANKSPYYWQNTMQNGQLYDISNISGQKWVSFVSLTQMSEKADKLPMTGEGAAIEDNLTSIDSNGNIKDAGIASTKVVENDKYYKNLHAGLADNLFGEAYTDDVFTLRTTAGNQDIASGDMPYGDGKVKKIEGNTVVWNQQANITGTSAVIVSGNTATFTIIEYSDNIAKSFSVNIGTEKIIGHKYYVKYEISHSCSEAIRIRNGFSTWTGDLTTLGNNGRQVPVGQKVPCSFIVTVAEGNVSVYPTVYFYYNADYHPQVGDTITVYDLQVFDLTLLGIDSLTTVDEVEQWLADNVGAKEYYEYNPGELIPVKDYSIKSTGFNLFDNEWKFGYISSQTGEDASSNNQIVCKNFLKIFPNTKYYVKDKNYISSDTGSIYYYYYDASKQFISSATTLKNGRVITTPSNAYYIRIGFYSTDLNQEYIVNLSYRGDRNGEYEEHWKHTMPVDITKLTGRLNGTGEDVVVFPDGMKKAGTVRDEIVRSGDTVKAIKRIGSVDLGTLTWNYSPVSQTYPYGFFNVAISEMVVKEDKAGIACARYEYVKAGWNKDKVARTGDPGGNVFFVIDSAYTDAATFKAAMSGVIVYYELATPEEYILDDEVLPIQYRVDDYGIEEVILDNEEGVTSCSPKMTINYGLNAAKTIGDLPHEYISIHRQAIDEGHQAQARHNINAASQDDFIRIQEQLDAINPKVDNDVYVDLGLPSGLLWAKRNIDVTQPDGFASSEYTYDASFFSWGNTEGHNPISTTAFDYDFGSSNDGPYASTPGAKLTGNIGLSYDAARVNLGAPWRMPTKEDFQELSDNCDFVDANGSVIPSTITDKTVIMNSINGIRLKSKKNGNILFLPCCGQGIGTTLASKQNLGTYYQSYLYSPTTGGRLYIHSSIVAFGNSVDRFNGLVIRPVM